MQESSSSLEEHPLGSCACQVPFILQEKRSIQSLTSLTILKFHFLVLFSQHTAWWNNIRKLSAGSPCYSQTSSIFFQNQNKDLKCVKCFYRIEFIQTLILLVSSWISTGEKTWFLECLCTTKLWIWRIKQTTPSVVFLIVICPSYRVKPSRWVSHQFYPV